MEEKIITGHKNGMLVLLLELVLYIAAVVFLIVVSMQAFCPLSSFASSCCCSAGSLCAACAF